MSEQLKVRWGDLDIKFFCPNCKDSRQGTNSYIEIEKGCPCCEGNSARLWILCKTCDKDFPVYR